MTNVTRFLTRRLKLKVNEAKSAVARPVERKFLGFSFSNNKEPKRRICAKGLVALQAENSGTDATDTRNQSGTNAEGTDGLLKGLEELLRLLSDTLAATAPGSMDTPSSAVHDLEAMETREAARYGKLRQRGVGQALAAQTAGSPHGPWRLANSPALSIALPLSYFDSLGLPRLFDGLA